MLSLARRILPVLLLPLLQMGSAQTISIPPRCPNLSLNVKVVQGDLYRFRMEIRNSNTRVGVTLPERYTRNWKMQWRTSRGWKPSVSGGEVVELDKPASVPPSGVYTQDFDHPDLWGDEATPHPAGTYRVTFSFVMTVIPDDGESKPVTCTVTAQPVFLNER